MSDAVQKLLEETLAANVALTLTVLDLKHWRSPQEEPPPMDTPVLVCSMGRMEPDFDVAKRTTDYLPEGREPIWTYAGGEFMIQDEDVLGWMPLPDPPPIPRPTPEEVIAIVRANSGNRCVHNADGSYTIGPFLNAMGEVRSVTVKTAAEAIERSIRTRRSRNRIVL